MSKLKLNLKRVPVMSLFIEGLSLFRCYTLDLVFRVNKLFLECDVTKLSGTWDLGLYSKAQIEIKTLN